MEECVFIPTNWSMFFIRGVPFYPYVTHWLSPWEGQMVKWIAKDISCNNKVVEKEKKNMLQFCSWDFALDMFDNPGQKRNTILICILIEKTDAFRALVCLRFNPEVASVEGLKLNQKRNVYVRVVLWLVHHNVVIGLPPIEEHCGKFYYSSHANSAEVAQCQWYAPFKQYGAQVSSSWRAWCRSCLQRNGAPVCPIRSCLKRKICQH